jgi:hypothetical protein
MENTHSDLTGWKNTHSDLTGWENRHSADLTGL